jgi:hypothetical protein
MLWSSLIMQFSPTFRHFIIFRSKYSPQHPVLKHPQSMFLSWCQRQSFTTIQNHSQIIILYILIFMFLDSRRGSGLNSNKHYPSSVSS